MFSLCVRGFCPGSPPFSHSLKWCNRECEWSLYLYVALWWVGDWSHIRRGSSRTFEPEVRSKCAWKMNEWQELTIVLPTLRPPGKKRDCLWLHLPMDYQNAWSMKLALIASSSQTHQGFANRLKTKVFGATIHLLTSYMLFNTAAVN